MAIKYIKFKPYIDYKNSYKVYKIKLNIEKNHGHSHAYIRLVHNRNIYKYLFKLDLN